MGFLDKIKNTVQNVDTKKISSEIGAKADKAKNAINDKIKNVDTQKIREQIVNTAGSIRDTIQGNINRISSDKTKKVIQNNINSLQVKSHKKIIIGICVIIVLSIVIGIFFKDSEKVSVSSHTQIQSNKTIDSDNNSQVDIKDNKIEISSFFPGKNLSSDDKAMLSRCMGQFFDQNTASQIDFRCVVNHILSQLDEDGYNGFYITCKLTTNPYWIKRFADDAKSKGISEDDLEKYRAKIMSSSSRVLDNKDFMMSTLFECRR